MESQKSRFIITSHLTHGKDARIGLMNQESFILAILDRSLKDARYREYQQKYSSDRSEVQRNGCHSSRRSYWQGYGRGARSIQITLDFTVEWSNIKWTNGSSRWLQTRSLFEKSPVQAIRRLPEADPTAVSRPTKKRMQILRNISLRSTNWSKKLSGNFGRFHCLLHPGGRVIIGMNGTITTHKYMVKILVVYEEFHIVRCPRISWSNIKWKESEQEPGNQRIPCLIVTSYVEFVVRNTF